MNLILNTVAILEVKETAAVVICLVNLFISYLNTACPIEYYFMVSCMVINNH